jgi:hypothetical protein
MSMSMSMHGSVKQITHTWGGYLVKRDVVI